jgi:bud site selection protein 31
VPKKFLSEGTVVEDINCGCHGCASGGQGERNIFGNKYGQYLAAIQVSG